MHRNDLRVKPTLESEQTVLFAISNGNGRQACSVRTQHQTQSRALTYFHHNRPMIEQIARECLASGSIEDGQIKLVML